IEMITPIRGMKEQLIHLQNADCTLGILTSNSEKNVVKFLERNNMQVFDFIYSGSSLFGKEKVIRSMLREKKFDPDKVIYVGDEGRDIEASKKAGVKVAAVTWGFSSRKGLETYKPDFLLDTPEELTKLISY
ncbi:MAG TPA: HAD-IA family hydrolase, partial [Patescibacteria group bacterium]|nr:HAD-IA family hydrolase [Patescibacteria group bacterium]